MPNVEAMNDVAAEPWYRLARPVILRWRLQILGSGIAATLVLSAIVWTVTRDDPLELSTRGIVAAVIVVPTIAVALVWPPLVYRRWRYRLAHDALELERGVIVHRRSAVPYSRVQQIDVTRGVLDRMLGLSVAKLLTASAGTDGSVPGLTPEEAEAFRRRVLERAGRDDAV